MNPRHRIVSVWTTAGTAPSQIKWGCEVPVLQVKNPVGHCVVVVIVDKAHAGDAPVRMCGARGLCCGSAANLTVSQTQIQINRFAMRTNPHGAGEDGTQLAAQRGDRVGDVTLCTQDCPAAGNLREGQALGMRSGGFFCWHGCQSSTAVPPGSHTPQCSDWRGDEILANLGLHSAPAPTPASSPDHRARCASACVQRAPDRPMCWFLAGSRGNTFQALLGPLAIR